MRGWHPAGLSPEAKNGRSANRCREPRRIPADQTVVSGEQASAQRTCPSTSLATEGVDERQARASVPLPHDRAEFAPPLARRRTGAGSPGTGSGDRSPESSTDFEDTFMRTAVAAMPILATIPAIERAATLSFQTPDDGQARRRLRPRADPLIALLPTKRRAER